MNSRKFDSVRDYFLANIRFMPNRCIEWTGATNAYGYGVSSWRGRQKGAHRLAYELFVGEIPSGLYVLHSCDNPACVNVRHLEPGTQRKNMRDAVARGRSASMKLTDDQCEEIRRLYNEERVLAPEIGRRFGVSPGYVRGIAAGRLRRKDSS